MKQVKVGIFLGLHFFVTVFAYGNQAVTNRLCPGRFGDKILFYAITKWVSYRFNLPLFLQSFEYSSLLRLGKEEKKYSTTILKNFKDGLLKIRSEQDVIKNAKKNIIFESDKYFYVNGSHRKEDWLAYIAQDKNFMKQLRHMLHPAISVPHIKLPSDKITVAVHIRKGGGVDKPLYSMQYYPTRKDVYADKQWPRKFPPEQYYVDQIKKISNLFGDKPLFVFIFTDDRDALKLVKRIKKAVNKNNVVFSCRDKDNAHDVHVVEDFYNMASFDCLIRSNSCFSMAAQLLGNHQLVIFPKHATWEDKKLIIDEVTIVDNRAS